MSGTSTSEEDGIVKLSHRELRTYILDDLQAPELIKLEASQRSTHSDCYIGRIAYLNRGKLHTNNVGTTGGFRLSRRRVIIDILSYLSSPKFTTTTIDGYATEFTRIIDWIDSEMQYDFTESIENARMAYSLFTAHLQAGVKLGDLRPITAANKQRYCRLMLKAVFPNEDMDTEIFKKTPLIKRGRKEPRDAPDKDVVEMQVSLFINILTQFTDYLVSNKPFPWYFSCDNFDSYVFPTVNRYYISTPYNTEKKPPYALDFEKGLVRNSNEVKSLLPQTTTDGRRLGTAKRYCKSAANTIKKANSMPHTKPRYFFATLSMQAYLLLFMHATGSNLQSVADQKFDGKYEVSKDQESKEFRTIKFRSGGREVSYTLGRRALKLFKIYLKLRKWVLGDLKCDYLFFQFKDAPNSYELPVRIEPSVTNNFHNRLEGTFLAAGTEPLGSSKLRRFKSDTLEQIGEDITTTSKLLQHTDPTTTAEHYAGGNKQRQEEEFANYWEAIDRIVLTNISSANDSSKKIPSGSCSDHGKPIPIKSVTPIEPSCSLPHGCLFCEHYAAHAEEEDIYKLTSLQYFIETVLEQFPDLEHAYALYGKLLDRIKGILKYMEAINDTIAGIVGKTKKQVFEEHDIHLFWDMKLQRLDRLGVLLV